MVKKEELICSCKKNQEHTFKVFNKNNVEIVKFRDLILPDGFTEAKLINYKLNSLPKEFEDNFSQKVIPNIVNFVDYNSNTYSVKLSSVLFNFIKNLAKRDLEMIFEEDSIEFDIFAEFYYRKTIYNEVGFYSIRDYVLKNFTDWSEFLIEPGLVNISKELDASGESEVKLKDLYQVGPIEVYQIMTEILFQKFDPKHEAHQFWKECGYVLTLANEYLLNIFTEYFKEIGYRVRFTFEGNNVLNVVIKKDETHYPTVSVAPLGNS